MTKWSDPLQILITCVMEVWLRRLRLGFLVCVRPVLVSSFPLKPHLNSWHHFEGSFLKLASLGQSNWTRAVSKCAPCPDFALLSRHSEFLLYDPKIWLFGCQRDTLGHRCLGPENENEKLVSKLVEPEWGRLCESRHNRSSLPCSAGSPKFHLLEKTPNYRMSRLTGPAPEISKCQMVCKF